MAIASFVGLSMMGIPQKVKDGIMGKLKIDYAKGIVQIVVAREDGTEGVRVSIQIHNANDELRGAFRRYLIDLGKSEDVIAAILGDPITIFGDNTPAPNTPAPNTPAPNTPDPNTPDPKKSLINFLKTWSKQTEVVEQAITELIEALGEENRLSSPPVCKPEDLSAPNSQGRADKNPPVTTSKPKV